MSKDMARIARLLDSVDNNLTQLRLGFSLLADLSQATAEQPGEIARQLPFKGQSRMVGLSLTDIYAGDLTALEGLLARMRARADADMVDTVGHLKHSVNLLASALNGEAVPSV